MQAGICVVRAAANHASGGETGPALDPPALDPPALDPPALDPPALDPPALDPPALDPPALDPPALDPPALDPEPEELVPAPECRAGDLHAVARPSKTKVAKMPIERNCSLFLALFIVFMCFSKKTLIVIFAIGKVYLSAGVSQATDPLRLRQIGKAAQVARGGGGSGAVEILGNLCRDRSRASVVASL